MEIVRQKNVATIICFPIVDADGDPVVSAAGLDSEIDTWTDGAAPDGFADCTNEAIEIDAGVSGVYYLSLTQAEMNNDYIYIRVYSSTAGAKVQHILIRTMVGDPLLLATTTAGTLVQAEVTASLVAHNLDHLALTATAAADMTTEVADNTILSRILGNGDTSTFVPSTDGLHAAGVDLDTILADTNELQGDWTNAGRLDAILDIIAADTTTDIPALIATAQADLDTITGATGVNLLAATQASIDAIEADTNELQSDDYPTSIAAVKADTAAILTDTGTTLDGNITAIKAVTDALTSAGATKLATSTGTIITGAVAAGTLSTTQMTTDLTEDTDDHYNGRIIIWTSGVLLAQATDITDYDGATKMLTFTAVTEAPTAADTFIIV